MALRTESRRGQEQERVAEQGRALLVERNLPLVKYILGKLSRNLPRCVDRDDLLAAGSMGLMEAAKRYDASRNVPFHSYAIPRIWGAMLDELRSRDWLSTDMRDKVNRLQREMRALQEEGIARPTRVQLAEKLGVSVEEVERLIRFAKSEPQLAGADPTVIDQQQRGLYARVGTRPRPGPYEEIESLDRKQVLAAAISDLPEREKQVMLLRYREELYLHEIGRILAVSESRVCQIHRQALNRLRKALNRKGL